MLIRPKSATRTRTMHVDSTITQNDQEGVASNNLDENKTLVSQIDCRINEELDTSNTLKPRFDFLIGDEDSLNKNHLSVNQNKSVSKRSVSSQDYLGKPIENNTCSEKHFDEKWNDIVLGLDFTSCKCRKLETILSFQNLIPPNTFTPF